MAVLSLRPASDFFRLTTSWFDEPKASWAGRFSPDIVESKSSGRVQSMGMRVEVGMEAERRMQSSLVAGEIWTGRADPD